MPFSVPAFPVAHVYLAFLVLPATRDAAIGEADAQFLVELEAGRACCVDVGLRVSPAIQHHYDFIK